MKKVSELIGMPVLDGDKDVIMGYVRDVFIDQKGKKILFCKIEKKRWRGIAEKLYFDDILSYGERALVVASVVPNKKAQDPEKNVLSMQEDILDIEVISRKGQFGGILKDFIFNELTGNIEAGIISSGFIEDCVAGRKTFPVFGNISFSDDYLIVEQEAIDEIS